MAYSRVQYLGILAPAMIALITGLVIHSFIITVNISDWWEGRSVTPVDHIITSLGISRMCSQCVITLYLFMETFSLRNLYSYVTLFITDMVYAFLIHANIWLTSLLSIVFCLKISNLQTRLFLYLRRMIVQRTAYFIAASVFVSAFFCFINVLIAISEVIIGGAYNTTLDNLLMNCPNINDVYISNIGVSIPVLFCYISSIFLFISLYHHTTMMKRSSNITINLEIHHSAMKFVSFTFIYNTMYFIGHFLLGYYNIFYCASILWLYVFLDFLPILHSFYLIFRTAKLRSQMSKVLHNANYFFQRKETENRENIDVVI